MSKLTEWYYPGGYLYSVGNLPAYENDAWYTSLEGWELFFLSNPNMEDEEARLRFYFPDKEPVDTTYRVPAQSSVMFPIFERKNHYLTGGYNSPFGIRIQSRQPIMPHITRAEYESWSDQLPGAMFGVTPYQGPLSRETCWYIADGLVAASNDHPLVFQEWVQVLNPQSQAVSLAITVYLPDKKVQFQQALSSERVALIKLEEHKDIPANTPFALKVEADLPIIVQQIRRGLEKGAHPATKSIMSTLGVVITQVEVAH